MNYLGISYGSYLGATYANLFPNRVRRSVNGDTYGGTLVISRAEVYRSAVDLVLH